MSNPDFVVVPLRHDDKALKALLTGPDWQKHVERAKYERALCERVGLKDRIFHSADFSEKCDPAKFYPAFKDFSKAWEIWLANGSFTVWPNLPDGWHQMPLEALEELKEPLEAGMFERIIFSYSMNPRLFTLFGKTGDTWYPIVFWGQRKAYEAIQEKLKGLEAEAAKAACKEAIRNQSDKSMTLARAFVGTLLVATLAFVVVLIFSDEVRGWTTGRTAANQQMTERGEISRQISNPEVQHACKGLKLHTSLERDIPTGVVVSKEQLSDCGCFAVHLNFLGDSTKTPFQIRVVKELFDQIKVGDKVPVKPKISEEF